MSWGTNEKGTNEMGDQWADPDMGVMVAEILVHMNKEFEGPTEKYFQRLVIIITKPLPVQSHLFNWLAKVDP